ncbi:hypothetical protein E8E11_000426 [Didymella keratinophila]|nr:hypothetical protein E8E11_000426 [Didymella keratinophila]
MGWTYNTPDSVPNDKPQITAVAIVFTAMSLSILLLRFYVRGIMIKAIGAGKRLSCSCHASRPPLTLTDNYVLIFTWITACDFAVLSIICLGLKHLKDVPNENIHNFGLDQYMGAPL